MKLSQIRDYLAGVVSFEQLRETIKQEIAEYSLQLKMKGGSIPVNVIEDIQLSFGEKELLTLGNSFLDQDLAALEIGYIADALLLSNQVEFKNENVKEALEQLTDPEINGAITESSVREILHDIK